MTCTNSTSRPIQWSYGPLSARERTPMRRASPKLQIIAALIGAALLLANCGGTSPTSAGAPGTAPQTADEVHARWITAIREGDRTAARSLVVDEAHAALAEDAIRTMQNYMTATTSPTGPLQDVQ